MPSYQQVELCNGQKPIMPGQKAAEGLFPVCIEVSADVVRMQYFVPSAGR